MHLAAANHALLDRRDEEKAAAVRRINDTLQGPVLDILGHFIPELRKMPREMAYEHVLDDLGLLERCLQTFNRERRRFRYVVVDSHHQPVDSQDTRLACGRTLSEVIAMVVRTAAKRYFRRAIAPGQARPVRALAHSASKPLARSAADDLYDAIKDYLLHDWQVPLVPAYADMSPALVRDLGPRLLDIHDSGTIRSLIEDPRRTAILAPAPSAAADIPSPPAAPVSRRADLTKILSADGTRLRAEAFTATLLEPDVRAVLRQGDQTLRITSTLREVAGTSAAMLVEGLGMRMDQLAALLLVVEECVGGEVFVRIFGRPCDPELVERIIQRARAASLCETTPVADYALFARELFSRFASKKR